jgi:hypothetical protein
MVLELHSEKINWRNTDLWLSSCKLQVDFFTQCCSGTGESGKGQACIVFIKQSILGSAACVNAFSKLSFGQFLSFHFLVYLPSNNSFQRNSSAGLKQGFLLQKIIETRSNVFL